MRFTLFKTVNRAVNKMATNKDSLDVNLVHPREDVSGAIIFCHGSGKNAKIHFIPSSD
jgi:hypothetical protein